MLKIDFNQAQKWYERLSVTNENITSLYPMISVQQNDRYGFLWRQRRIQKPANI